MSKGVHKAFSEVGLAAQIGPAMGQRNSRQESSNVEAIIGMDDKPEQNEMGCCLRKKHTRKENESIVGCPLRWVVDLKPNCWQK
jgi:hypothetical protein